MSKNQLPPLLERCGASGRRKAQKRNGFPKVPTWLQALMSLYSIVATEEAKQGNTSEDRPSVDLARRAAEVNALKARTPPFNCASRFS